MPHCSRGSSPSRETPAWSKLLTSARPGSLVETLRPWTRARPRVLAGSTLGLAGVGAALVLALSGSAAPPAFAITRSGDGSVLVNFNYQHEPESSPGEPQARRNGDPRADHDLHGARGGSRQWPGHLYTGAGRSSPSGPPVKVLVGTNGTEVIGQGKSAGNTAEGTFHLDHCVVTG